MKTQYRNGLVILACGLALSGARTARAEGAGDGNGEMLAFFFGTADSAAKQKACTETDDTDDSKAGMLGLYNRIMCHLEKDFGITGNGSFTKTFNSLTVHAEISDGAAPYAHKALVWVCKAAGSVKCAAVADFSRLLSAQWSYSNDGTVNAAAVLMDPSAYFDGTPGSGFSFVYDVGTATATQSFTARVVRKASSNTFNLRADAKKVTATGVLQGTIVRGSTTGATDQYRRMDFSIDQTNNLELAAYERGTVGTCNSHGRQSVDAAASADAPTCTACYARAKDDTTGDYSVTEDATKNSCSSLSLLAYPSDSATAVGQYTTADDATHGIMSTGTTYTYWDGMAATPSAL